MFSMDSRSICALLLVGDFFWELRRRFREFGLMSAKNCLLLSNFDISGRLIRLASSSSAAPRTSTKDETRPILRSSYVGSTNPPPTSILILGEMMFIVTLVLGAMSVLGGRNLNVSLTETLRSPIYSLKIVSFVRMSFASIRMFIARLLESLCFSMSAASSFSRSRSSSS